MDIWLKLGFSKNIRANNQSAVLFIELDSVLIHSETNIKWFEVLYYFEGVM